MSRVKVIGGLGNRLRAVLSRMGGDLEVVWEPAQEICGGRFLDVFEPLEGVTFFDSGSATVTTLNAQPGPWLSRVRLLRPRPDVQKRIDWIVSTMNGPYDAMHIRRTDHVDLAMFHGQYTHDAEFLRFAARNSTPLYLATDNGRTQRDIKNRVPRRVVWEKYIEADGDNHNGGDGVRHTSLADAVVDMFVCVGAESFMGSGGSSFSHMIEYLRMT